MANFKYAWIGYQNWFTRTNGGVTASGSDASQPVSNLRNWYTWQKWKGNAGTTSWWVKVDCSTSVNVNYAAICAHNLRNSDLQVFFEGSSNNTTWTTIFNMTPSGTGTAAKYNGTYTYNGTTTVGSIPLNSSNNISVRFDTKTYRYFRFRFVGTTVPEIGVLSFGVAMDFPVGFYGGMQRPAWNVEIETTNSKSERGVFLGRSTVRSGVRPIKLDIGPVTHAWVDSWWTNFTNQANYYPFIFTWEPDPLDLINGTLNATDCMVAWLRDWKPPTLKDQRHAMVGLTLEGTLE